MTNAHSLTPFSAIVESDLRYHVKRVAPYVLMAIFSGNAALWWGAGPAPVRGWATNSEMFIVSTFAVFTFMTLPFFTALMMGDPVIRDFEIGIDPLVFSKPVSRLQYLLAKFAGNFFVLVCCQSFFALTLVVLQAVHVDGMLVVPSRVIPYAKHFFLIIVLSSLPLAVLSFTIGTLTRNVKLVYGMTTAVYLLYVAWQTKVLKSLLPRWQVILDPLLMNWGKYETGTLTGAPLNQVAFHYDAGLIANRLLVISLSVACFALLYWRFGPSVQRAHQLAPQSGSLFGRAGTRVHRRSASALAPIANVQEPSVQLRAAVTTSGARTSMAQLAGFIALELRLLLAERSLFVLTPLALVLGLTDVAHLGRAGTPPHSAQYAIAAMQPLLLLMVGVAIVYVGEAMHRDRTLNTEPLMWALPIPNSVLLLSKLTTVFVLSVSLSLIVALGALAFQLAHGHGPIELVPYLTVFTLVVLPGLLFILGASTAINVIARDKVTAYAVSLAIAGFFYLLYVNGYHHWLYNPLMFGLWTYPDIALSGGARDVVLLHRLYVLLVGTMLLTVAHVLYERRPHGRGPKLNASRSSVAVGGVALFSALALGALLWRAP